MLEIQLEHFAGESSYSNAQMKSRPFKKCRRLDSAGHKLLEEAISATGSERPSLSSHFEGDQNHCRFGASRRHRSSSSPGSHSMSVPRPAAVLNPFESMGLWGFAIV
jgi:hypothetical protein